VDYTSDPITATFSAGATIARVDIPVTMDNIAEQSETFDLSLTIPPTQSDVVLGATRTAVGNITDATSKISVGIVPNKAHSCVKLTHVLYDHLC